ncbi:MAG: hypothetical protein V3R14_01185 [Nitrospinaceae bacterium]
MDWYIPEVEAEAIESQPDKPKARKQPMRNLMDDFISKNQVGLKGNVQEAGCDAMKDLRLSRTFTITL